MKIVFETETLIEDFVFVSNICYLYSKDLDAFFKINLENCLWENLEKLEINKGELLEEKRSIGKQFKTVSGENTRDYGDFESKVIEVDVLKLVYEAVLNCPKVNLKKEFAKEVSKKLKEIKIIDCNAQLLLRKGWEDKILNVAKISGFKFRKYPDWELGIKYDDPSIPQRYKKHNPFTFENLHYLLDKYREHLS